MCEIVYLFQESIPEFLRRAGQGKAIPTTHVGTRFGWDCREARRRLEALERRGEVRRAGMGRVDVGTCVFWIATDKPVPRR